MSAVFDVIVVGAGVEGHCLYFGEERNSDSTAGTGWFPLPHSRRSSHGQSRITRLAYGEHQYTAMMLKAMPLWRLLEMEAGVELMRFVQHGGTLKDGEPVLEITPGDQTTVRTTKPQLIKVCYWAAKDPQLAATQPTLYFEDGRHAFYGLPAIEYPGLYKFCLHSGPVISAEFRDGDPEGEAKALRIVREAVKAYLPGLEPKPAIVENCVYTWTPDAHPILDRHPFHPNIILGVGFSGHGFKLAPAVGEILSDLALGRTPAFDISLNTIKRFYKPRFSMQIMLP